MNAITTTNSPLFIEISAQKSSSVSGGNMRIHHQIQGNLLGQHLNNAFLQGGNSAILDQLFNMTDYTTYTPYLLGGLENYNPNFNYGVLDPAAGYYAGFGLG